MARKNPVEAEADKRQAAHGQGGGGNGILALRQLLGGNKRQARNTSEALGMGFREFILPMLFQAAQDWKANYDARGDFKTNGADVLDRFLKNEQLSQSEQELLDNYQKRYPKEYAEQLAAARERLAQQQQPTPQPTPQGTPQPVAPNQPSAMAQEIAQAANLYNLNPNWQATPPADEANGGAFSGVNYDQKWAQDSQQILNGLTGGAQDGSSDLYKWILGGWR